MKPKPRLSILIVLLLCGFNSFAQSFEDLERKNGDNAFTEDWFKVMVRYTSVKSTYTPNYSGGTVNVAFRWDKTEKWDIRSRYENPSLGDFIYALVNLSKQISNGRSTKDDYDDHAHGGGILGWAQFYANAVAKDKLLISPGITMGDYMFGSRYQKNNQNKAKHDPYGYYLAAGPAFMATYLVNKKLWIDGYVNYDIALVKVKNDSVDPKYPKPSFLTVGADLNTVYQFFGGFRINQVIDGGYNKDKSSRLDISVGMCF